MQEQHRKNLKGISGWLIFVALDVILAPCWFVVYILSFFSDFFTEGYWTLLTHADSEYYTEGFALSIVMLLGLSCFRIAAGFYAIYLFLHKKAVFPSLYIVILISMVVLNLGEVLFIERFLRIDAGLNWLYGSVGSCVIWGLYLTRSKRVKQTFTQPCGRSHMVFWISSIFIVLSSGFSGYFYGINNEEAAQVTALKHTLSDIAVEINRVAPGMLDDEIRFDSVQANNLTLEYRYSLIEYEKKHMDVDKFSSVMIPRIIREDCLNKNILVLMEQGAVLSHTYFDLNGERLAGVEVDREKCLEARLSSTLM
ncbi:hypothetical protein VA7868_03379 [Vibrio aerogenes CECT 7868]|uniref:Uncharacterized protein n=1 Tax=Vibrio aerogenes CECT 7868 TaxID=1216006 RepID=A0A1M5ZXH4_9VIBR|nr:DUF2569 domain-containing protein [Vibrio aerogenes]SHI28878.1 hypothetical protein VA7868_03379 [Vibrio aerogenes CECT 7868]